jgi:hypothetical protein
MGEHLGRDTKTITIHRNFSSSKVLERRCAYMEAKTMYAGRGGYA